MNLATLESRKDYLESYQWSEGQEQSGAYSSRHLNILPTKVLESSWCSIYRVSLGTQPHRVHFRSPYHTITIFDEGSFVDGERRVNGMPVESKGPLDRGVDIVPANCEFDATVNYGSNIKTILITIDDDKFGASEGIYPEHADGLQPNFSLQGEFLNVLATRLRECSMQGQDACYLETLTSLLFQEIIQTQNSSKVIPQSRSSGGLSPRAKRIAREFLHENMSESVDLNQLAEHVGLSRFHFSREFKASFGVPPHKYLLNLRIQKASDLLRDTKFPITDIALEVGFSSSSDFSRAFKQIMNCSPREFRSLSRSVLIV